MFIISTKREAAIASLNKYSRRLLELKDREGLEQLSVGTMQEVNIGRFHLCWFRCKPSDNLHVFEDGVVIGKLDFAEPPNDTQLLHPNRLPAVFHSLTNAVVISNALVTPINVTNIYYGGGAVSDMQLLIAEMNGYQPSPEGVALLCSIGYFPGNTTLFREVVKIPLLHSYGLVDGSVRSSAAFHYRENDDDAMIARLTEIVPRGVTNHVGMTGGYDSRFVLGVLYNSGGRVEITRFESNESHLVSKIAAALNLPNHGVLETAPKLAADFYALLGDSQIKYGGHQFSGLRRLLTHNSVYHTGHFADSIIKNAFKTAWKIPSMQPIFERLIDHALLSRTPKRLNGLASFNTRTALRSHLLESLDFEKSYYPFPRKKEWANWFYFINRGVRWAQSYNADLSYFAYPVYLLSDLHATSLGISSSAWANFSNDRVRELNRKLLPTVITPYLNGQSVRPQPPGIRELRKIKYEYGDRLLARYRLRKKWAAREKGATFANCQQAEQFGRYFTSPLSELLLGSNINGSVKPAALIVNSTLAYLHS
jgi:hypothetical protein